MTYYSVAVVNGTADKETAAEGETVTVTADEAPEGKVFDKWTGEDVTFADAGAEKTTFAMPAKDVTVTATYKDAPVTYYSVTVVNGTADRETAAEGETVTVTADEAPEGKVFDKWTGEGVTFADASAAETTFEMPAQDVTVTANYAEGEIRVIGVKLDRTELTLLRWGKATLKATVLPENAPNRAVTWSSSDASVAAVDRNGVVTAGKPGTATVTVTTKDGGKTAKCAVTVLGDMPWTDPDPQTWPIVTTVTNPDGSVTRTELYEDGSKIVTRTMPDKSAGTAWLDPAGRSTRLTASLTEKAVTAARQAGKPVTLPMPFALPVGSPPVEITLPAGMAPVTVEIPVDDPTPGTVAVLVRPDGTEEIVRTCTISADGVVLTLGGNAAVKLADRSKRFDDVPAGAWFADYAAWASARGIMIGTDRGFEPHLTTSRAMVAQILYNIAGAKAAKLTDAFDDVKADCWYAPAVSWAYENGILEGIGGAGSFGADEPITREETARMLWNFAKYLGRDVTPDGDLSGFTDAGAVSEGSLEAMRWAVGIGLVNGMGDGTLDPGGSATRAQIAALIERMCELVLN